MTRRASKSGTDTSGTAREQMALRCFQTKQRALLLQTLRYALQVKTEQDLPKVFQVPVAVALKPGSWEEMADRFSVPEDKSAARRTAFESAKALYCRSSQYEHALRSCEQLFSIDMDPAGPSARPENNRSQTEAKTASATDPSGDGKPRKPPLNSCQKRTFFPEQFDRLRARFRDALAVSDDESLPAFLAEPRAIPLKIGTDRDLVERYGLPTDRTAPERGHLGRALHRYCSSFQYQHAILSSDTRFSIDMEPEGEITEAARQHAIIQLRKRAEYRQARREKQAEHDSADKSRDPNDS